MQIKVSPMHKTTDGVPQWQREDEGIDFALSEGLEEEGYDEYAESLVSSAEDAAAPPTSELKAQKGQQEASAGEQKKEYPTTEHAMRTLALHTGLGYILGFGVGLVGKAQSIFRVTRMVGAENAHMHYVDPFAVAGEFARPLFMVACLEVASMYAGPAAHNLRLPWKTGPLTTNAATTSPPSRTSDNSTVVVNERGETSGLAWETYEHSEDQGRAEDHRVSSAHASPTQEELARGTAGRREYTALDSQAYGEPLEEDLL